MMTDGPDINMNTTVDIHIAPSRPVITFITSQ
jgi:hypothetical protein